jgi:TPR repeat protein
MAAQQGYSASQYNLGGMYSRGLSTTLSREEAVDWLGRAAEQGHRSAARELAALQSTASVGVEDSDAAPDESTVDSIGEASAKATL